MELVLPLSMGPHFQLPQFISHYLAQLETNLDLSLLALVVPQLLALQYLVIRAFRQLRQQILVDLQQGSPLAKLLVVWYVRLFIWRPSGSWFTFTFSKLCSFL